MYYVLLCVYNVIHAHNLYTVLTACIVYYTITNFCVFMCHWNTYIHTVFNSKSLNHGPITLMPSFQGFFRSLSHTATTCMSIVLKRWSVTCHTPSEFTGEAPSFQLYNTWVLAVCSVQMEQKTLIGLCKAILSVSTNQRNGWREMVFVLLYIEVLYVRTYVHWHHQTYALPLKLYRLLVCRGWWMNPGQCWSWDSNDACKVKLAGATIFTHFQCHWGKAQCR